MAAFANKAAFAKALTLLLALAGSVATAAVAPACSGNEEVATGLTTTSSTQTRETQPTTTSTLSLESGEVLVRVRSDGTTAEVRAEVADDQEERSQGLMHRENLPEDRGMLFVFPREGNYSFWMKDTLIPLDMLFINEEGQVVGIVENAQPHTTEPQGVAAPTRFVLEVNAGWTKQHGVGIGDRVEFQPSPTR